MNRNYINVQIPVSPETASRLQSDTARKRAGDMVSALLAIGQTGPDPLRELLTAIKQEAGRHGLTDIMVDDALAALNAGRRI